MTQTRTVDEAFHDAVCRLELIASVRAAPLLRPDDWPEHLAIETAIKGLGPGATRSPSTSSITVITTTRQKARRLPPHDVELEEQLLGSAMLADECASVDGAPW